MCVWPEEAPPRLSVKLCHFVSVLLQIKSISVNLLFPIPSLVFTLCTAIKLDLAELVH